MVNFTVLIGQFVKANTLGVVFGAEIGFRLASDPDTVRAPDLAFVRRERIPEGGKSERILDPGPGFGCRGHLPQRAIHRG